MKMQKPPYLPGHTMVPDIYIDEYIHIITQVAFKTLLAINRNFFGLDLPKRSANIEEIIKRTGLKLKAVNKSILELIEHDLILKQEDGEYILNITFEENENE